MAIEYSRPTRLLGGKGVVFARFNIAEMPIWIFTVLLVVASTSGTVKTSITDICVSPRNQSLNYTVINLTKDEDLRLKENCRINSVVNLTIQGSPQDKPTIRCNRTTGVFSVAFVFTNAKFLTIKNIKFVGCGGILEEADVKFNNYDNYSANFLFNFSAGHAAVILCNLCTNLILDDVSFSSSTGYAFAAINLFGDSLLDNVLIDGKDNPDISTMCADPEYMYAGFRGILLLFLDCDNEEQHGFSRVSIVNSKFDSNHATPLKRGTRALRCVQTSFDKFDLGIKNNPMPDVGALTVVYNQKDYRAEVLVLESDFTNNAGLCYGAVLVIYSVLWSTYASQVFQNCSFIANYPVLLPETNEWSYIGKDITLYVGFKKYELDDNVCISITQSSFLGNSSLMESRSFSISLVHLSSSHG